MYYYRWVAGKSKGLKVFDTKEIVIELNGVKIVVNLLQIVTIT